MSNFFEKKGRLILKEAILTSDYNFEYLRFHGRISDQLSLILPRSDRSNSPQHFTAPSAVAIRQIVPSQEQGNDSASRLIDCKPLIQRVRGILGAEDPPPDRSDASERPVKFARRSSKFKFIPISCDPAGSLPISQSQPL